MPSNRVLIVINFLLTHKLDFMLAHRCSGELDYIRLQFSRLTPHGLNALQDLVPDAEIIPNQPEDSAAVYHHFIDFV